MDEGHNEKEGESVERTPKSDFLSRRVLYLSTEEVRPNPAQPRRFFEEGALGELAESIRRHGILQPLTVRVGRGGYELIAGERRLRAARMAGLRTVPCIVAKADEETSSALALVENLQRRDLHFFEEAVAIAQLIANYGLSQEEAAERLGKSQSAVANKLRLLRLSPVCAARIRDSGLTERHARTLLRLCAEEERCAALSHIIEKGLNVTQSEAYIEELIQGKNKTPPPSRPTYIIKDTRLFLNSVSRGVDILRRAGVAAQVTREEGENEIRLLITVSRQRSG